ncbi:MAG: diacylglycerol kinase family protein [Verrucomicrobiota bacterium]
MSIKPVNLQTQDKPSSVMVVVNPAPSRRIPLLAILNQAFRDAGIHWDISITHGTGDGCRLAKEAAEKGFEVVAVYGGDGTVMEVASGLVGTNVPLLILGGGTGNLVASELRLPNDLERACDLICGDTYRTKHIDVGMMGEKPFLLRIGCGIEVGVVQEATRELKDQFGKWAYVFAAIKMLQEVPEADYEIVLDGNETVQSSGVACVVANAGTVGVGRLTLAPSVDVNDGKLDVFLLRKATIEGIVQLARKMMGLDRLRKSEQDDANLDASNLITHWSVTSVDIKTDPIIDIQVDGDVAASTPQEIKALPDALRVVV